MALILSDIVYFHVLRRVFCEWSVNDLDVVSAVATFIG